MGTLIHACTCNETLILVDVIQICVSRSAKSSFIKVLGKPYTTHMTLRYPGHPALTHCSNPKPIGSRRNRDVPHNFSATHFSSRFWPLSGPDDVETLWTSGPTRSDRLCCRSAIKKPSASRYFRLFVTNSLRLPNTPLETILYFFELRIRKTLRRNSCAQLSSQLHTFTEISSHYVLPATT